MNYPSITSNKTGNTLGSVQGGQPLQLREGQLFHGKISQLFPGEMAEVQIGSQKMTAKLEVPLRAGDSYYFQVKSPEPDLQLKIVSGPHAQSESQTTKIGNLLETLQLPKTPQMRQLAEYFMKHQIPLSKEALIAGEALLRDVPPSQMQAALASIGKLVNLKLPISPQLFQAMMGIETKEGLHHLLDKFQLSLAGDENVTVTQKRELERLLQQTRQPLLENSGKKLLAQTLFTALDKSALASDRFQAVQLLKSADILPSHASLANLSEVLAKLIASSDVQMTENLLTQNAKSPASQSTTFQQVLTLLQSTDQTVKLPGSSLSEATKLIQQSTLPSTIKGEVVNLLSVHSQTNESTATLLEKVSEILFKEAAKQMLPIGSQTNSQPNAVSSSSPIAQSTVVPALMQALIDQLGGQEKLASLVRQAMQSPVPEVHTFMAAAEAAASEELTGANVKQAIQSVLSRLGVTYEALLAGRDPNISQLQDTLKPHLVSLVQEGVAGSMLREMAESVVSRLNGQPLQSVDTGTQQQIIMQAPLQLFARKIDATIEWNGRLKENGKLDPDHARILFYLDLEVLKKTVVDMQVQNKVITLTIYNDDSNLQSASTIIQDKLESALEDGGYKLSAVRFKQFQQDPQETSISFVPDSSTGGVDVRI